MRQVKGFLASPGISLGPGATSVEEFSQAERHTEGACPSLLVRVIPCQFQVGRSLKMRSTSYTTGTGIPNTDLRPHFVLARTSFMTRDWVGIAIVEPY